VVSLSSPRIDSFVCHLIDHPFGAAVVELSIPIADQAKEKQCKATNGVLRKCLSARRAKPWQNFVRCDVPPAPTRCLLDRFILLASQYLTFALSSIFTFVLQAARSQEALEAPQCAKALEPPQDGRGVGPQAFGGPPQDTRMCPHLHPAPRAPQVRAHGQGVPANLHGTLCQGRRKSPN